MTRLNARFSGQCRCGAHFEKGAAIVYDKGLRRVVGCPVCCAPVDWSRSADDLEDWQNDEASL